MRASKRSILLAAVLLSLTLLAGCQGVSRKGNSTGVPVTLADGASTAQGAGVEIAGDTVTFTQGGTYRLSGTLTEGSLRVDTQDPVELILDGVAVSNSTGPALDADGEGDLLLTLAEGAENTLTTAAEDPAVEAKGSVTLAGEGSLTLASDSGHGLQSKGDLTVTGGSLTVTAAGGKAAGGADAGAGKGLLAAGDLNVTGGVLALDTADDGLHAGDDLTVTGGVITVLAGDDALHADGAVTVQGGALTVDAHEGLEGETVAVSGGVLSLTADDDGVNAGSKKANALRITGGVVSIFSQGDCLDANGGMAVTGGELTLYSAAQNPEDGILDSKGELVLTGGTVLAAGAAGTQMGFGETSSQGSVLAALEQEVPAGTAVVLTDESGAEVARFTPEEAFSVVLVSVPGMAPGRTYTLTVGDQVVTVTA